MQPGIHVQQLALRVKWLITIYTLVYEHYIFTLRLDSIPSHGQICGEAFHDDLVSATKYKRIHKTTETVSQNPLWMFIVIKIYT